MLSDFLYDRYSSRPRPVVKWPVTALRSVSNKQNGEVALQHVLLNE